MKFLLAATLILNYFISIIIIMLEIKMLNFFVVIPNKFILIILHELLPVHFYIFYDGEVR